MGFDKENLVLLHHAEAVKNGETLANVMDNVPGVVSTTYCTSAPPRVFGGDSFSAEGVGDKKFQLNYTKADEDYIPTLGIKMRYGRNFQAGNAGDSMRIILNESAVHRIGWELDESVIGKYVTYPNAGDANARFEVIGVMADFNFWSISSPIEALAILHSKDNYVYDGTRNFLVVKVQGQNAEAWNVTLDGLKNQWKNRCRAYSLRIFLCGREFCQDLLHPTAVRQGTHHYGNTGRAHRQPWPPGDDRLLA